MTAASPDPALYSGQGQAAYVPTLAGIDDSDRAFFYRQGYLAVENVFSAAEVEAACQALDDLIDGKNPEFKGLQLEEGADRAPDLPIAQKRLQVRKLMTLVEYDPRLKALAAHPALLAEIARLMDGAPALLQDMALLKPPRIGREKPWHQDCAYFNIPPQTLVVGVWIALDEAGLDNGCLYILPGSHRDGPQFHFKRRDWQLCDSEVETAKGTPVPLRPGGCLLWNGLLHHGSPHNASDRWRRALQFHYKPHDAAEISTEERMGLYGGEVRGATC